MIRSSFLWFASGFITASLVITMSYAVAPDLLQIDLIPAASITGSPLPSITAEITPIPTETAPTDTPEPSPDDDMFAGIPRCPGDSLLELGDEEEEESPLPSGVPDSMQCNPPNCSVGGEITSGGQQCIKDGSQVCLNAGNPELVLVHVCPGLVTTAEECVPQEVEKYLQGACSASDAPGCAAVSASTNDVTSCSVCWRRGPAETRSLGCSVSASVLVSVNSECRPGPPRAGQNGIEVDSSGCEYDPTRLECFGTCFVTVTDSVDCETSVTLDGSCTDESETPTPTPFSTVSATPTPFFPTPTPILTVTPTPFFPTPTPITTPTSTATIFITPTPFPTVTPASFSSVVKTFFSDLFRFF